MLGMLVQLSGDETPWGTTDGNGLFLQPAGRRAGGQGPGGKQA